MIYCRLSLFLHSMTAFKDSSSIIFLYLFVLNCYMFLLIMVSELANTFPSTSIKLVAFSLNILASMLKREPP